MLQYAEDSVETAGCDGSVRIFLGDMVSAEIPGEFDAAINLINSIGYLHSDDDVVSHLRATGSSLREGGVYLVQLNFAHEGKLPAGDHWRMEREGISVKTFWRILREDRESRLSHQLATFEVGQDGKTEHFDDRHTLKLWLYPDMKELVHRSGMFEIAAVYGGDFEELKDTEHLSGEHGNVYIALLRN